MQRDLLELLQKETAVVLLPGVPAPTLLVMAPTEDEDRTRAALKRLSETLPKLLPGGKVTDLGLSVAYGIVEQHQGVFKAESGLESGAAFHIELPIPRQESPDGFS